MCDACSGDQRRLQFELSVQTDGIWCADLRTVAARGSLHGTREPTLKPRGLCAWHAVKKEPQEEAEWERWEEEETETEDRPDRSLI
jgi:hypothetical protein